VAEQLGWRLPDVILYRPAAAPGDRMWKAFQELRVLDG